jgi:Na+/H+-translocating membrane pyrophosphatase
MGAIGLIYTFIKTNWVAKQDAGNDRMKEISNYIAEGAMAFLKAEEDPWLLCCVGWNLIGGYGNCQSP